MLFGGDSCLGPLTGARHECLGCVLEIPDDARLEDRRTLGGGHLLEFGCGDHLAVHGDNPIGRL